MFIRAGENCSNGGQETGFHPHQVHWRGSDRKACVTHPRPFLLNEAKLLLHYDFMNLVNFKLRMRILQQTARARYTLVGSSYLIIILRVIIIITTVHAHLTGFCGPKTSILLLVGLSAPMPLTNINSDCPDVQCFLWPLYYTNCVSYLRGSFKLHLGV